MQISVIIPCFNRADLLPRAIDSVLNQTSSADEIIVVDDGSEDGSAGMIEKRYPDIHLIKQNNHGVSHARNTAIKAAKSNWIALLDSDDEWLPDKLERQREHLKNNPGYKLVHTDEIWIRNGVRVNQMNKHQKRGGDIFQYCLPLCCISPSSTLIEKSLLDEVGLFDENLPACEDYDLWLKICSRYSVLYLDEKLIIKHGGHADQLSQAYWGMDRFRIESLEKLLTKGTLNPSQRSLAIVMLVKKIRIFLNGAKKRGNNEYNELYQSLLDQYEQEETESGMTTS